MKPLDARSIKRLEGVHPDLVKVVNKAADITSQPFIVVEGLRDIERQKKLVASGASKTMRSRHLTGHAVDLVAFIDMDGSGDFTKPDNIRWDWPLTFKIAEAMRDAAKEVGVLVEWGGTWKLLNTATKLDNSVLSRTFADGPHFQLPWASYPL